MASDEQILGEFSDAELELELKRRKDLLVPVQKTNINDSAIRSLLDSIVQEIVNGTWHEDNDDEQYIYEEVFKMYYGKSFFTWFNKITS